MKWYLALLLGWLGLEIIRLLRKKRVINPLFKRNIIGDAKQAKLFLRTGIIIGLFAPVVGTRFHTLFYLLAGVNLVLGIGIYLLGLRRNPRVN